MDKTYTAIQHGQEAKSLLENETLKGAFDVIERSYFDKWRSTNPQEVALREKLWIAFNTISLLRNHLGKVLADGKLAEADLRMKTEKKKYG